MRLHDLTPPTGAKHSPKRVGRGIGSGHGKTSTRGHKGQKARAGGSIRPGFEGGQTKLYMRLRKQKGRAQNAMPRRMFEKDYAIVNVGSLQQFADTIDKGTEITPQLLLEKRVIRKLESGLRVLGEGEISLPVTVHAHHFSESAKAKIEAAGGKALLLKTGAAAAAEGA